MSGKRHRSLTAGCDRPIAEETIMRTRSLREWKQLYEKQWRPVFAHLPKEDRAKLVRGCMGKAIYDTNAEAERIIDTLTLRRGELLGSYECPLCAGIHTGQE